MHKLKGVPIPPRIPVFNEWQRFARSQLAGLACEVVLLAGQSRTHDVAGYYVVRRGRGSYAACMLHWNDGVARYDCLGREGDRDEIIQWLRMLGVPARRIILKDRLLSEADSETPSTE